MKWVIGCGGSGAKCIEALVHLYAAGIKSDPDDVGLLFVDRDRGNGNRSRSVSLADLYKKVQGSLKFKPDSSIFVTPIKQYEEFDLSSLAEQAEDLKSLFKYHTLEERDQKLFDLFFTEEQKEMSLDEGYRCNASVGAANFTLLGQEENLNRYPLLRELEESTPNRVFVFASLFGGTGAAVFPNLPRFIWGQDGIMRTNVGGGLLLPYFHTKSRPLGKDGKPLKVGFDNRYALLKARESIRFYHEAMAHLPYKNLYLAGDDPNNYAEDEEYSWGGQKQKNKAHYVEVLAGLGALHYFARDDNELNREEVRCYYGRRRETRSIVWDDFPKIFKERQLEEFRDNPGRRLSIFSTFAMTFLGFYYPLIRQVDTSNLNKFNWINTLRSVRSLRSREDVRTELSDDNQLIPLVDYLESFLKWLHQLNSSTKLNLRIVASNSLDDFLAWWEKNRPRLNENIPVRSEFPENQLRSALSIRYQREFPGYHKAWDLICEDNKKIRQVLEASNTTLGKFCLLLYNSIEKAYEEAESKGGEGEVQPSTAHHVEVEEAQLMFLPKMRGARLHPPATPGEWEELASLLEDVTDDIDVRWEDIGGSPPDDVITALPTPWARPLFFAQALRDEDHPLHKRIQGEWRGLWGTLCFSRWLDLAVETPQSDDLREASSHLIKALSSTQKGIRGEEEEEHNITMILCDGELLGGFSPETILFTAPDSKIPEQIPWAKETDGSSILYDPADYFKEEGMWNALNILKNWVMEIHGNLQKLKKEEEEDKTKAFIPNLGDIVRRLEEWRDEIKNNLPPEFRNKEPEGMVTESQEDRTVIKGFHIPRRGKLNTPDAPAQYSPLRLKCSSGEQVTPPIIIWKGMDGNNKIKKHYGIIKFSESDFPSYLNSGNSIRGVPAEWIRAEYLLTDTLQEVKAYRRHVLTPEGDRRNTYLMPLKGEILNYLSSVDAKNSISARKAGNAIEVKLALSLVGGICNCEKKYSFANDVNKLKDVHPQWWFVDVWPDKEIPDWEEYWLLCRDLFYKDEETSREKTWRFEPLLHEGIDSSWVSPLDGRIRLYRMNEFPQVLKCTYSENRAEAKEMGLLFPDPGTPPKIRPRGKAIVAVDLGTSNTAVYYQKEGQDTPTPLVFKKRVVPLVYAPETEKEQEDRLATLEEEFFPPEGFPPQKGEGNEQRGETIFPTLYLAKDPIKQHPSPPGDGLLCFLDPVDIYASSASLMKNLVSDLKWGRGSEDMKGNLLLGYLKHLTKMIGVELIDQNIKEIELKWAYPASLGERLKVLKDVWEEAEAIPRVRVVPKQGFTEGVAAAWYMGRGGTKDHPYIVVDMGGATTDIALLSDSRIVQQASIRLAGNLLASLLHRKKDEVIIEASKESLEIPDEKMQAFKEACKQKNELMLNYILQRIEIRNIIENKSFLYLRLLASLLYSSVIYVVGMYFGKFIQDLKQSGKSSPEKCTITLGGNGSRMIDWLHPYRDKIREILEKFFRRGAKLEGSDLKISIQTTEDFQPNDTKLEVVKGLLKLTKEGITPKDPPDAIVLIGEDDYLINDHKLERTEDLNAILKKYDKAKFSLPKEFPCLKEILEMHKAVSWSWEKDGYNSKLHLFITRELDSLQDGVNTKIKNVNRTAKQPFLVLEVTELLKLLSEEFSLSPEEEKKEER